jgi:hypothetical protein
MHLNNDDDSLTITERRTADDQALGAKSDRTAVRIWNNAGRSPTTRRMANRMTKNFLLIFPPRSSRLLHFVPVDIAPNVLSNPVVYTAKEIHAPFIDLP